MRRDKDVFKWTGRWISADFQKKPDEALMAPYFRKEFTIELPVESAVLYISGLGYYKASINGMPVSDEVLAQAYTKYDSTVFYQTYDIKEKVSKGRNSIGIVLGNGWYNCFTKDVWNSREATWRSLPKLIAEVHIRYSDGSCEIVISDSSWKCSDGPIVFNGIRNGEYYDARLQKKNWDKVGYDDSSWGRVLIARSPGGVLKPFKVDPIRITRRIKPARGWRTPEGGYIFDIGVNMAGFCKIGFKGSEDTEATIKYSEILAEDGIHINQSSISGFVRSGEFQTDKYIKATNETEYWHPDFVYHGFQYVEVTGCNEKPEVEAMMINTDFERRGWFLCSDENLNALYNASNQSILSNFHGLPTDDPHREKNAWTGDISLSAEQMLLNFDTAPIFRKWLGDIRDTQKPDGSIPCVVPSTGWGYNWGNGPDWSSALTLIPWYIYLYTGSVEVIIENYDAIKRHFGFMESMTDDGIVNYGIGDWCPPFEGKAVMATMSSFKCPVEVTDTAYYFNAANTIAMMAAVLGKEEERKIFSDKAMGIKDNFRRKFFDAAGSLVKGDCQTSLSCMIYQELCEESEIPAILKNLLTMISDNDFHQDTGILGNKYLHNILGEAGLMDVSLKMILNETYPSFRNWIDRGATTLWECWNGEGSRNHHMFSDFIAVLFKYLGGIKPDESGPGFRKIIMKPQVKCGLDWVK
ncbi:MAG: family 78 glycoside hydrolase catalytic domain, partial [Clostridia bacterium]|nr:family 78 glycoside hydrolase catalytic domain [Clostridia bacterium]